LLAGLTVATHYGLNLENAVKIADRHYVGVNIFDEKNKKLCKKLRQLPASCFESADALLEFSDVFTQNEVFSKGQIEAFANFLKSYKDKGLSEALYGKNSEISELVSKYLHFA
jgi:glutamine synthetase